MQEKRNNHEENENFQNSDQRNIRNQNNENHPDEERLKKDKNNPYTKDGSEKQHQGTGSANTFEGQQTDGEAANRHGAQNPENNRDNRANDTNN